MKRKTKQVLILTLCTPPLVIALVAGGLFIKIKYDFPADKHGHQQLQENTGVSISNTKVFVQYTGWTDTQTYFRFIATSEEIERIVKSKGLNPAMGFFNDSSFYWWKPNMTEGCKYFRETDGGEWTWLYYNPATGDAYYFASTY